MSNIWSQMSSGMCGKPVHCGSALPVSIRPVCVSFVDRYNRTSETNTRRGYGRKHYCQVLRVMRQRRTGFISRTKKHVHAHWSTIRRSTANLVCTAATMPRVRSIKNMALTRLCKLNDYGYGKPVLLNGYRIAFAYCNVRERSTSTRDGINCMSW